MEKEGIFSCQQKNINQDTQKHPVVTSRQFVEANSVMVASWEVLIFQIVVSHRPLFNLGVLSGILFNSDLGSFEHLCATPFVSKNDNRKTQCGWQSTKRKTATIDTTFDFYSPGKSVWIIGIILMVVGRIVPEMSTLLDKHY